MDDNQITAFHGGAMQYNCNSIEQILCSKKFNLAIVAPDCKKGVILHTEEIKKHKIPYIFDPGQGLPELSKEELKELIGGSRVLIVNDYEAQL